MNVKLNKLKDNIAKYINLNNAPYILLLLAFTILHVKLNTNIGDDVVYREKYKNLFEVLINFYKTWGAPSLTSVMLYVFIKLPQIYFKIFNVLCIMIAAYSILKITNADKYKNSNWMIMFFIMLYPFLQMNTAGWISTSITYLFPLSAGLYSFVYLRLLIDNKNIGKFEYCLFWIALVIGVGSSQMCCIILGIYMVFNVFFALNKKIYKFAILQNVTAFISIVYQLTSPGNVNRSVIETTRWFSDFNMISTLNKIKMGFTATLGNFISTPNLFFLCFSFLLFLAVKYKHNNFIYRFIAIIPFTSSLIFGIFPNIFSNTLGSIIAVMNNGSSDFIQIGPQNFDSKILYLSIILGMGILGAMMVSIYLIFENTLKMLTIEMIFGAGFCSRLILSFSPTLYASNTRTFIFFYFAIMICAIFIFNEINNIISEEKQKDILLYIGVISILNYLQILTVI